MKDRSRVSKALNTPLSTGFLFARQTICCLTALTFCLQGSGIFSQASARSTQKESSPSYARPDKQKIARLPFGKKEEVDEESEEADKSSKDSKNSKDDSDKKVEKKKKKKDDDKELKTKDSKPKKEKKKKKDKKEKQAKELTEEEESKISESESKSKSKEADEDHVDIQEVDIIEVDQDEDGAQKSSQAKPSSEVKEEAEEAAKSDKASLEEPRLLPDSALISVLKDISKSLSELDENTGINDPDEHKIVKLSKEILDKSLAADGVEADRILRPEHRASAKSSMVVEAWSSGDVKLRDNLRGSVAAVWGKRIDGIINVTIAGECKDLKAGDGSTIGKFIVIVSAKSPVKKGFDIQSQSDVTFWLGEVGKVDVDAAGLKKPEKKSEDGKEEASGEANKTGKTGDPEKKKSLVTLEPVLTDRKREYLARYESYQSELEKIQQSEQQKLEQKRIEKERLIAEAEKLKQEKIEQEKAKSRQARRPDDVAYGFYPDDVEIIEIVEEIEPAGKDKAKAGKKAQSVESDYDNIQEPEKKEKQAIAHTRRKRTIRRVHRKPQEVKEEKETETEEKTAEKALAENESKSEDKEAKEGDEDKELNDENKAEEENEENDEKGDADVNANADTDTDANKDKNAQVESDSEIASKTDRDKVEEANEVSEKREDKKAELKPVSEKVKEQEQEQEQPGQASTLESASSKEERELKEKLASITKIAPIKPRTEENDSTSSPSPATASSTGREWESPAVSYIMKQPSLGANLIYPDRAIAGNFLTVAVLDKYGNPEASVELSFNGATISTDARGQAMFMVPEDATPGRTLHVSLAARPELIPGVIDVLQPLFSSTEANAPTIDNASKLVPNTKVLVIDGHDFMGMAGKNRVMIDNSTEAQVVASSPVQLKLKMPESLKPGTHKANIANSILRSNPIEFEFVKAAVLEGKKAKKGAGDLIVKVEGTSKPVHVRLTNKTPDIIKINKGDELIVTTSGGEENTSRIEIKRLQKGDYRVDARIEM